MFFCMIKFDDKFLDELKSKLNIVDVIGGYCQLTRKGGSYWACCPLPGHSEKTPSFAVNEAGQFYKCFGCGRGGDVVKFIMEMESLNFYEAVIFLCDKAHIPLPEDDGKDSADYTTKKKFADKERLQSLMRDTALFYVAELKTKECAAHRKYLEKRGLTSREVTVFGIGASPDYDKLPKYLAEKGYTKEEMTLSGAVTHNKERNSYYDALATRLIFPIIDAFGKVIAFGGRKLEKTDFGKYKNTTDSQLFSKRKTLYNLNILKKEKNKAGTLNYVIMVEGYMDTIALYKAGFKNVVASMGTSLTVEQARLLKRYTDTVLICYDGDKAGQNATIRGLEILRDSGLEVRVVSLPDGLDPDELINERGAGAYQQCLDEALPLIDFKLSAVKAKYDTSTTAGRRKYIDESLKVIAKCDNESLKEDLLKKLRDDSGITFDSLKRDLERGETTAGALEPAAENGQTGEFKSNDGGLNVAERFVLASYISGAPYADDDLSGFEFSNALRSEIAEYVSAKKMLKQNIEADKLKNLAGENDYEELMYILSAEDKVAENARARYYYDCVNLLKEKTLNKKITELKQSFALSKDVEERKILAKKISELAFELAKTGKRK